MVVWPSLCQIGMLTVLSDGLHGNWEVIITVGDQPEAELIDRVRVDGNRWVGWARVRTENKKVGMLYTAEANFLCCTNQPL